MKLMKLITTIAITLCIALLAYEGFQFLGGDNSVHTGINFLLIICSTVSLISFRLSIQEHSKYVAVQLLLVLGFIGLSIGISGNKELLLTLWNYAIAIIILQQGLIILSSKKPSSALLSIIHYVNLITILSMTVICIFEIGHPAIFTAMFYALIAVSIGAITRVFAEKNQST